MGNQWDFTAATAIVAVLPAHPIGRIILYLLAMWAVGSATLGAALAGAWRAAIPFGLITLLSAYTWYRLSQRAELPEDGAASERVEPGCDQGIDNQQPSGLGGNIVIVHPLDFAPNKRRIG
jgi:hypothetical protein